VKYNKVDIPRPVVSDVMPPPRSPVTILSSLPGYGKTCTSWGALYINKKFVNEKGCPRGLKTLFEKQKIRSVERILVVNTEGHRNYDALSNLQEDWGFDDFRSKGIISWYNCTWEKDMNFDVFLDNFEMVHSLVDKDGKRFVDDPNTAIIFDSLSDYWKALNNLVDESKPNQFKWGPRNMRRDRFLDLRNNKSYWAICTERVEKEYKIDSQGYPVWSGRWVPKSREKEEGYKSDLICALELRENDIFCDFIKTIKGLPFKKSLPLGKWTLATLLCHAYGVDATPVK